MVSGTGTVSKEITEPELIQQWGDVLKKWHSDLQTRPKQVRVTILIVIYRPNQVNVTVLYL